MPSSTAAPPARGNDALLQGASFGKLRYIDALRGWAILGVVLIHTLDYGAQTKFLGPLFTAFCQAGGRGIQLFFIASAFTLFLSMDKRHKTEKHPVLNFFIRRFFRIAPLFYLGILYYISWDSWAYNVHFSRANVLSTFLFINWLSPYFINNVVPGGWSITVEMTFYAIAPFLFFWLRTIRITTLFIAATIAVSSLLIYWLRIHPLIALTNEWLRDTWNVWLFLFFPNQLAVFGYGIFFYFLQKRNNVLYRPIALLVGSLGLMAVLVYISSFAGDPAHRIYLTLKPPIPSNLPFGIAFVLFALALSQREFRLFVNRIIIFIGKISFSLYLIHFAIFMGGQYFDVWNKIMPAHDITTSLINFVLRYFIALTLSIGLAYLSFRFIETPSQQMGKRIIARLEQ